MQDWTEYLKVLIESDWNLKAHCPVTLQRCGQVLIESDWNLKSCMICKKVSSLPCINRIRLEFKVAPKVKQQLVNVSINRIRLEFKADAAEALKYMSLAY